MTATFVVNGSALNVCSTTYFTRSGTTFQYMYQNECNIWLNNGAITSPSSLGSYRQFKLRYWDYNGRPDMTITIDGSTVATISTDQYGCGSSGCVKIWTSPVYDYWEHTIHLSSSG